LAAKWITKTLTNIRAEVQKKFKDHLTPHQETAEYWEEKAKARAIPLSFFIFLRKKQKHQRIALGRKKRRKMRIPSALNQLRPRASGYESNQICNTWSERTLTRDCLLFVD